jgi:hypothetical protein
MIECTVGRNDTVKKLYDEENKFVSTFCHSKHSSLCVESRHSKSA